MDLTFLAHLVAVAFAVIGLSAAVRFFDWLAR